MPGHDGIHIFWLKKFTTIHDRLAFVMNRCLQEGQVPERMTKGKTTLIQKKLFWLITCQPMMWKKLTAQIMEENYFSLTSRELFAEEEKWYRKGSRGIAELLYIDQDIPNESKTRRKNLAMAWTDYKKAYDKVSLRWIIKYLKMYKISDT